MSATTPTTAIATRLTAGNVGVRPIRPVSDDVVASCRTSWIIENSGVGDRCSPTVVQPHLVPRDAIDIDVDSARGVLTIRADRPSPERKVENSEHDSAEDATSETALTYRLVERRTGIFQRTLRLPDTVDVDAIDARLEHGVLEVRLPKQEAPGTRKIDVRAA